MSIVSNHFPEAIDEMNGADQRDSFEPTPADWADFDAYVSAKEAAPAVAKLEGLASMLEGLILHAETTEHKRARGKAARHQSRGLAIAYRNCLGWLKATASELAASSA